MPVSKRWPKVSVIISTFNRPAMLKEALESVAMQTFDDFEVWVVDDGSNTAEKVCEEIMDLYVERGIRLNCLNLPVNSGYQSVPKNHGIQLCDGTYIAYLDDDNLWDRNHLEILVDEIEKGSAELVYSLPRYVGQVNGRMENGRVGDFVQATPQALIGVKTHPKLGFIDTSGILHSKAAFRRAFGGDVWNEKIRRFGDWDLICRAANSGLRMRGINKDTYTYRWHDDNLQIVRPMDETSVQLNGGYNQRNRWSSDKVLL